MENATPNTPSRLRMSEAAMDEAYLMPTFIMTKHTHVAMTPTYTSENALSGESDVGMLSFARKKMRHMTKAVKNCMVVKRKASSFCPNLSTATI